MRSDKSWVRKVGTLETAPPSNFSHEQSSSRSLLPDVRTLTPRLRSGQALAARTAAARGMSLRLRLRDGPTAVR